MGQRSNAAWRRSIRCRSAADPARRHPVRAAARRPGGAAARSRHRRALDLRQPRQRRRPGDVGQPGRAGAQSAHHARRAARAGWWRSPACASPASAARSARVSGNRPSRRACIAARSCPRTWPGLGWREEHIAALIHSLGATAIWPEDYDYLASQRADILVTHEAPRSHPAGNAALDALARAMGASLIVHGHHHVPLSRRRARRTARDGRRRRLGCHDRRRAAVARRGAAPSRQLIGGWSLEADATVTQ